MEQEFFMNTKISSHNSKFDWSIENATKIPKLLWGEKFSLRPKCKTKLQGVIKIAKYCMNNHKIYVGFKRIDRCKDDVTVITSLKMCDSRGKVCFERCARFTMSSKDGKIHWCIVGTFSNFQEPKRKLHNAKRHEAGTINSDEDFCETDNFVHSSSEEDNPFLNNDMLLVKGNIKIFGCCIVSDSKTVVHASDVKENQMAQESMYETINDLKFAYESNSFTDLILKVDSYEIHAHKFVLSARCPYFCRILNNSENQNTNYLNIVDMDKYVLESFLRFLYTGVVGAVRLDTIEKLYAISDKYEVHSLKKNCSSVIRSQVNSTNACDFLILANEHKDINLKRFVVNFIIDHFKEAEISYSISTLVKTHSDLVTEVMHFKSLRKS